MKKLFPVCAAAAMMLVLAACRSSQAVESTVIPAPVSAGAVEGKMSLAEAKEIIDSALLNAPTGLRPRNPGADVIASRAEKIVLSDRHDHCLVDVLQSDGQTFLRFYVPDRAAGEQFADAVWRLRGETAKK